MKRYLLSIILCLWASYTWAIPPWFIGVVSGGGVAAFCTGTELVCEQFNDAGTPSGWSTVTGNATVNYDNSTDPFNGTQYMSMTYNTTPTVVAIPFTESGTVYVTARVRPRAFPTASNTDLIYFYNNTTLLAEVLINTTGGMALYYSAVTAYSATLSIDTATYIKVQYTKGAGNGILTLWAKANIGDSWTLKATRTTGNNNMDANRIRLGAVNSASYDFEDVKITTTDQ